MQPDLNDLLVEKPVEERICSGFPLFLLAVDEIKASIVNGWMKKRSFFPEYSRLLTATYNLKSREIRQIIF